MSASNPFRAPPWRLLKVVGVSGVYQYAPDIYGIDSVGFASHEIVLGFERVIRSAPRFVPRYARIVYLGRDFTGHAQDVSEGREPVAPCDVLAIVTSRPMYRAVFKRMKREAPTEMWRKVDVFRTLDEALGYAREGLSEPLE